MSDVFEILKADHQEVESMLAQLVAGNADAAEVGEKLVMEESRHEAAEEMYFWPAVKEKVPGGEKLAEVALEQENEGKQVLDQLRKAESRSPEFNQLVAKFASAGRAHIAYEETEVWPKLQAALSADERNELGDQIEKAKKAGPTRPHPNAPDNPEALKTVGTATAMADKVADKITGRGH